MARNHSIIFSCTLAEKERIKNNASSMGYSVSAFLRTLALSRVRSFQEVYIILSEKVRRRERLRNLKRKETELQQNESNVC